jgi:maleate cis-trans isomerase
VGNFFVSRLVLENNMKESPQPMEKLNTSQIRALLFNDEQGKFVQIFNFSCQYRQIILGRDGNLNKLAIAGYGP